MDYLLCLLEWHSEHWTPADIHCVLSASCDLIKIGGSVRHWHHPSTFTQMIVNRHTRVIGFWHPKPGFRHTLSSTARKYAWKVHFYKSSTSAASESDFDHANRILRLSSVLVYIVSRLLKCQAELSLLQNRLWNQMHNFLVLRYGRRWERTTRMRLKLHPKPLRF